LDGNSFGPGKAMILFPFWRSQFQVVVPRALIDRMLGDSTLRHDLFNASSDGGWNTFYIAQRGDGTVTVHRKKHWRKDVEYVDTTILFHD